jgi:phosphate transport system substrate-binding protein
VKLFLKIGFYFCVSLPVPSAFGALQIRVGGGAAPIENIFKKIKEPFRKATGTELLLNNQGPDVAFIELEAGHLDLATAGLPIDDWLAMMKKMNHPILHPENYKSRTIGRDITQVYLNKSVTNLEALSTDKLKKIFTGRVKNWQEIGGPDLPIVIIYGARIPGTNRFWQQKVMEGAQWPANVVQAEETPDVMKKISSTKGAIGIGPLSAKNSSMLTPEIEKLGRPITATTKGIPSPEILNLYKFIDGPGQEFIK